jgi:hypothetical protein
MGVRLTFCPEMSLADLVLRDWFRRAVAFPTFRQGQQFGSRHFNERKRLAALRD